MAMPEVGVGFSQFFAPKPEPIDEFNAIERAVLASKHPVMRLVKAEMIAVLGEAYDDIIHGRSGGSDDEEE